MFTRINVIEKLKHLKGFEDVHPKKIFLIAAIFIGVIMVFLVPPFQSPDEPAHFFRAWQVSSFHLIPKVENNVLGGEVPESFLKLMAKVYIRAC